MIQDIKSLVYTLIVKSLQNRRINIPNELKYWLELFKQTESSERIDKILLRMYTNLNPPLPSQVRTSDLESPHSLETIIELQVGRKDDSQGEYTFKTPYNRRIEYAMVAGITRAFLQRYYKKGGVEVNENIGYPRSKEEYFFVQWKPN